MTRACALLAVVLCACETSTLPSPTILAVEPERIHAESAAVVTVQVNAVLPVAMDYRKGAVDPSTLEMKLWIGGRQTEIAFIESNGKLVAQVPEGLPLGAHEVRVALADGREAVRAQALIVESAPDFTRDDGADGGTEADGGEDGVGSGEGASRGGITGFQFDSIGEQVRHARFRVMIRALGPGAKKFQGTVSLRSSKGQVTPDVTGPFVDGVRVEEVSLSQPGPSVYLLVEDSQGTKGLSGSFRVRPH